jgi:hypothetical protein
MVIDSWSNGSFDFCPSCPSVLASSVLVSYLAVLEASNDWYFPFSWKSLIRGMMEAFQETIFSCEYWQHDSNQLSGLFCACHWNNRRGRGKRRPYTCYAWHSGYKCQPKLVIFHWKLSMQYSMRSHCDVINGYVKCQPEINLLVKHFYFVIILNPWNKI